MATKHPVAPPSLTDTERMLIQGIQAREQLLQVQIQSDLAIVLRQIEERLKLPQGSIPSSHIIDVDAGTVVPRPPPGGSNGTQ